MMGWGWWGWIYCARTGTILLDMEGVENGIPSPILLCAIPMGAFITYQSKYKYM